MISLYDKDEIYEMFLYDIKKESKAEGRAEGKAEGRAEGKAEGRAEGKAEGKEDVAVEMLKDNYEPSVISKLTKLSLERINELKMLLTSVQNGMTYEK